jgi:uncharacterized membrane protein YhaH (DUF805 family)
VNWYVDVLKNYVGFSGRARRQEYWMYFLFNIIAVVVLTIIDAVIKTSILVILYYLAVLLPTLAVGFRRLHDTGRSAWWLLLGIIPLIGSIIIIVFLASEGDAGENKYGPSPKQAAGHS